MRTYFVSYIALRDVTIGSVSIELFSDRDWIFDCAHRKMKELGFKEGEYAFLTMSEIPNKPISE